MGKELIGAIADFFEGVLEVVEFSGIGGRGDVEGLTDNEDGAGEGFGNFDTIPAGEAPAAFEGDGERENGGPGFGGEEERAGFGDIEGAARAIDGEAGGAAGFDGTNHLDEGGLGSASGAAAGGTIAEALDEAGNIFRVEAA